MDSATIGELGGYALIALVTLALTPAVAYAQRRYPDSRLLAWFGFVESKEGDR